jgi:hypothetical protein
MAGIQLSIVNILQLVAALSPILISSFFLMLTFMNQNVKGIVYIAGAILASVINILIMNQVKSPISPDASMLCNLVELPFLNRYNSPAPSSLFIGFTLAYMFLPMQFNSQMNYGVLSALLSLFALDAVSKVRNSCTTAGGVVLGGLVGIVLGAAWYAMFHALGYNNLLYFNEMDSNNVLCSRPSKQTFKCSVYKNGELVSSNIA